MDKSPNDGEDVSNLRRTLLKAAGGTAALASIGGIAGCSGGGDSDNATSSARDAVTDAASDAMDAAETMADDAMDAAGDALDTAENMADDAMSAAEDAVSDATDGLTRLSPSDAQAQALAYVDEASSIDASAQPRYEAGQACSNCALYIGESSDEWAACSIFPGRLVKGSGWCSVYAPKA